MQNEDRRGYLRTLAVMLALLLAVWLTGCTGGAAAGGTLDQADAAAAIHPAVDLPSPAEVWRTPSTSDADRYHAGSDYFSGTGQYNRVAVDGSTGRALMLADYDPQADHSNDGMAWCFYKYFMPDYTDSAELHLRWSDPAPDPQDVWIGLGNQHGNRWDWYRSTSSVLMLSSLSDYIFPDDGLVVAIVLGGSYSAYLEWLFAGEFMPHTEVVDVMDWSPGSTALAEVEGRPAIAYVDSMTYTLYYVRANDALGKSWGTPVTVCAAGNGRASLAVVSGRPGISCYLNGHLGYVWAQDATGSAWGTPVTIDSSNDNGRYNSMVVVDGNPAVAYNSSWSSDLRFVRSTDTIGWGWGAPQVLDSVPGSAAGEDCSLAIVNGNPAISYDRDDCLSYIRATDSTGATWNTPLVLTSVWPSNPVSSLCVVNGRPAIGYFGAAEARYVRAEDMDGAVWAAPYSFGMGSYDYGMAVGMRGGRPLIAFCDYYNGQLLYATANDATGTSWSAIKVLDNNGEVGDYLSMAKINGCLAMSYGEDTNFGQRALKYTVLME